MAVRNVNAKLWDLRAVGGVMNSADPDGIANLIPKSASGPQVISLTTLRVLLSGGQNLVSLIPQRSAAGANTWTELSPIAVNSTSYDFTGLVSPNSYDMRFKGVGAGGVAVYSNVVTGAPIPAPSTPALGAITNPSGTIRRVAITTFPAEATGLIREFSANGTTWISAGADVAPGATYFDYNSGAATQWYFRARAVNAGGQSPNSSVAYGSAGGGTTVFFQNFENNSLSPANGAAVGGGIGPTTVSTDRAYEGTRSAKLLDSYYEMLFTLNTAIPAITIEWRMWIPVGYFANRQVPSGGPNNKFVRIYSRKGYGSSEKVGASILCDSRDTDETFYPEWGAPGGNGSAIGWQGDQYARTDMITRADEGTWVLFKVFYSPPKASGQRGSLKFYKNNVLKIDATNQVNNFDPASDETHDVHEFYIMGTANNPRSPSLYYYIDTITVWNGEA